MSLLSLNQATFDYGREPILTAATLAIHPGHRYALVGPNGAGKTTLLALLVGELSLQEGQRQMGSGVRVRYLRQESVLGVEGEGERPLRAVVREAAFGDELSLQADLAALSGRLAVADPDADPAGHAALVEQQGRLQSEFERLEGYTLDTRLDTALSGVGLPRAIWDSPLGRLSGGERRRAALAATLMGRADLLLLDEPTNHLDLTSREWLEGFLIERAGAVVIISHDRWFLDRVTQRTLHLERGRLTEYSGNYTFYARASGERRRQDQAAWKRQQDHIRQTEAFIRKNIEGQKTKQAQARRKQLEKLDRVDRPVAQEKLYRFDLRPVRDSGGTVLQTEGVAKGFGARMLMKDVDLQIVRGERVGILGPNGCGKTTLLKIMAGLEGADRGRVVRGHNVDLGLYDQNLQTVRDYNTVLGEMQAVDPTATLGELRSFLAAFGFGEEMIDRSVASLSGGERGRLALLRLIKEGHNTLLLDEPTNHLDIRSRESLEQALREYPGTLIMVSHDRLFLDKLVDRLILFPEAGSADASLRVFLGTYGEYVRKRDEERRAAAAIVARTRPEPEQTPRETASSGLSKNEQARRRAWISEVEETIVALEQEKENALTAMSAPDCAAARRLELADRCATIETELEDAMTRWEHWNAEIDGSGN